MPDLSSKLAIVTGTGRSPDTFPDDGIASPTTTRRWDRVISQAGTTRSAPWDANMSLQGLTGSLSEELDTHQINVNIVCPGIIDTSRWDNKRDNTPTGREDWERLETNTPMGRPGTGTDVASTIVFLCSDQAHWISGQSINIDGGQVSSH